MDKKFLAEYSKQSEFVVQVATQQGLQVDFRDSKFLLDLCLAYTFWPEKVLWKEAFEMIAKRAKLDFTQLQALRTAKQWTNRYFDFAIKHKLILKQKSAKDKRIVVFLWTDKGKELLKSLLM